MKTGIASDELKGRLPALKDWTQSTSVLYGYWSGLFCYAYSISILLPPQLSMGKSFTPTVVSHITDSMATLNQFQYEPEYLGISASTTNI